MDGERWEQIQTLFHRIVDLPREDHEEALRADCGEDEDLLTHVRNMLEEDARSSSLLDANMAQLAHGVIGDAVPPTVSFPNFGRYSTVRLLGEGGMGLVFLAKREDLGSFVAIKVLRDAWLSPSRRERFASEERMLAQLNHPFIARLYDADTLGDGTPWFAMEYVEGTPLTDYCKIHHCSVERRLQLFRAVCLAVQYAHGQAVIHRDLKPSNILVKSDGSVRLLDFGIARYMETLDMQVGRTLTGLRLMTPAYASPEQIRGERVGVQTDVYSLGVILFELLAGTLPFDISNLTPREVVSILAEYDPGRPSALARHNATLPQSSMGKQAWADLDVLCLTAMHRDPQRRYQSLEALIRDIDHYLNGEPLEARPDTFRYRAGKFVRRNRRAVAAAFAVFLLVAALVGFFTVRVTRARDAALAEAAHAERIQSFMMDLFNGGDESAGPSADLHVQTLLQRGEVEAKSLSSDPKSQADLYETLGSVYRKIGKYDRADTLLNTALEQRTKVFGPESQETAETLVELSKLRMAQARYDEAEKNVRQAVAIDRKRLSPSHPALARAISQLGTVQENRGNYAESIATLNEAVNLQSGPGGVEADLASSLTQLASSQFYQGNYVASDTLNRRVLALDQRLFGADHPNVANDLINLALIQLVWGHPPEAETYVRRAVAIDEAFYGKQSAETASAMTILGQALVSGKHYNDARAMLQDALAIEESVYGKVHPDIASTLNNLGWIAQKTGRLEEAKADFTRMGDIYQKVYNGKHYYYGIAVSNLAGVYVDEKQYVAAEKLFRQAIAIFIKTLSPRHQFVGIARIRLGDALLLQKRYREAEEETRTGYEIVKEQAHPPADWLRGARKDLIKEYAKLNQPQKVADIQAAMTEAVMDKTKQAAK